MYSASEVPLQRSWTEKFCHAPRALGMLMLTLRFGVLVLTAEERRLVSADFGPGVWVESISGWVAYVGSGSSMC